jgi:hypothetical protein
MNSGPGAADDHHIGPAALDDPGRLGQNPTRGGLKQALSK